MTKRLILALAIGGMLASSMPGAAGPPARRDLAELLVGHANRYVPKAAGTEDTLSLLFGPYHIPPGQDSNRITLDLPPMTGFITAVAPELVRADDGRIPTEQEAHIHHAHWFAVDPNKPGQGATPGGLQWTFGTGEEKTQGLFKHRWMMEEDKLYGVPVDAATPQVLVYMIHNKTSGPLNAYVVLDIRFFHGTEASIEASPEWAGYDLRPMMGTLFGQTRDATRAYPQLSREYVYPEDGTIIAMGSHLHPGGHMVAVANLGPGGMCTADADNDGFPGVTILNSRKFDRVPGARIYSEDYQMGATKFGWRAPVHAGDVLVQYAPYAIYPGDTPLTRPSGLAFDRRANVAPQNRVPDYLRYSQEQWDALLANPDIDFASRFTSSDGLPHAYYEAMTYTGMYVDHHDRPLANTDDVCDPTNFRAYFAGTEGLEGAALDAKIAELDTFEQQSEAGILENTRGPVEFESDEARDAEVAAIRLRYRHGVTEGMINHAWIGTPDPLCGISRTALDSDLEWDATFETGCEDGGNIMAAWNTEPGIETESIHVVGFQYLPGGLGLAGALGSPAVVSKSIGHLALVNEDAALNIRHTFTTCPAPCNGYYQANYPLPDWEFDTDKMGNVDPIDGGFSGEWEPHYELDVTGLEVGTTYTYFCRIHPTMRGAFTLVE